jgi:hypothetical protein
MTMEQFADHVISVAQENKKSINNLQLQKILYFFLKDARDRKLLLRKTLVDLYDEPFLVWAYGPNIKTQYNRFRCFGSAPIIGSFERSPELSVLDSTIVKYLDYKLFDLLDESFKAKFYKENIGKVKGFRSDIEYRLEDL